MLSGNANSFSFLWFAANLFTKIDVIPATRIAATAGIFAAKFLEHKALSDLGIWNSRTENYYYRRIYRMVAEKIMPKIWVVAKQMLHSPQTAIYWGSYLMKSATIPKVCVCSSRALVTNSTLTFSDIAFLEINPEIAPC